jgi:hypothetical protein
VPNRIGFTYKTPRFRCSVPIRPGMLFLIFTMVKKDTDLFNAMPSCFACDSSLTLHSYPSLFLVKNQYALDNRVNYVFRRLRKPPDKFTFHIIKAVNIVHIQRLGLFDGIQRKGKQAVALFLEILDQGRNYRGD